MRGLSGAQFIRKQDYKGIVQALAHPEEQIIWLNASDPAQLWGKVLEHPEGRSFLNVPGTAWRFAAEFPSWCWNGREKSCGYWSMRI